MRKLTVDEIIQGLVDAYERLLKLESNPYQNDKDLKEYFKVKGEVKALRWVLGQESSSVNEEMSNNIDSAMPHDRYDEDEQLVFEEKHKYSTKEKTNG